MSERIPGQDGGGPTPPASQGSENPTVPRAGDGREIFERLYTELRALADRQMRQERAGLTLQPTALVHEAFLRLMSSGQEWGDERYVYAAAAEAMRRILIERARRASRLKHGGGRRVGVLEESGVVQLPGDPAAMLELHEALESLRAHDAPLADLVMLRYFAGLTVERVAAILGRSERSVKYDWAAARAWLIRRMGVSEDQAGG